MADSLDNARTAGSSAQASRMAGRSDVVRYASDNRFVRAVNALTTGPAAVVFVIVVAVAAAVAIYLPVRDLYIAYRSQALLEEQIAIRTAYNETLESEVEALLSEEGIQDAARKELGMVMEGETALDVTGLDEDGNAIVVETETEETETEETDTETDAETDAADATSETAATEDEADDEASTTPTTAAEVEAAEAAVYENSAWYWKALDAIFFFDGTGSQVVVSTGE